jgi:MFS family permease
MDNRGLRTAVILAGVASALAPVVAAFVQLQWIGWEFALMALLAFGILIAPHVQLLVTARYEPLSRGKLIGLLACELVFGLLPAAGLTLFLATAQGGEWTAGWRSASCS